MLYLVTASEGPGFESEEEAAYVLQNIIIPSFEEIIKLKKKKRILAGGLPVGERAFVFIAEADSNDELDRMLRGIPMWGMLEWEAVPLQSFEGRAAIEGDAVKKTRPAGK
jgi:hypothetical protein